MLSSPPKAQPASLCGSLACFRVTHAAWWPRSSWLLLKATFTYHSKARIRRKGRMAKRASLALRKLSSSTWQLHFCSRRTATSPTTIGSLGLRRLRTSCVQATKTEGCILQLWSSWRLGAAQRTWPDSCRCPGSLYKTLKSWCLCRKRALDQPGLMIGCCT